MFPSAVTKDISLQKVTLLIGKSIDFTPCCDRSFLIQDQPFIKPSSRFSCEKSKVDNSNLLALLCISSAA